MAVIAAAVLLALLVTSGPAGLDLGVGRLAAMCLHLLLLRGVANRPQATNTIH